MRCIRICPIFVRPLRLPPQSGPCSRSADPKPRFGSTPVSLVDFDLSRESVSPRPHHSPPQFVQPTPGRLVARQPQDVLQAQGTDPILLTGHPPQGPKPDPRRGTRVLENRPRRQPDLISTPGALPSCRAQRPGFRLPTAWAAEPFWPPQTEQILSAGLLRSEPRFELRHRARVLFHGLFTLSILVT